VERVLLICWQNEHMYLNLGDDPRFWMAAGSEAIAYSTGSRVRWDLRSVSTLG